MGLDIRNVKKNIEELNSIIQKEAQLELMMVLWSKFSPYCNRFLQEFPKEIRGYFYYLNIDNPRIRRSILNSKAIKVGAVPCVITFTKNGLSNLYEGYQRCKDIITFINSIHNVLQEKKMDKRYRGETSLSSILNIPENVKKEMLEESDIIEEPHFNTQKEESEDDEEDEEIQRKKRKKIKNARVPMKPNINIDPRDMNLSVGGYNRPDVNDKKKEDNFIVDLTGIEGDVINGNFEEMLNNDPTLDPDIVQIQNRTSKTMKGIVDTGEKHPFESVKKVADEMASLRDKEVTEHDMRMRGKTAPVT